MKFFKKISQNLKKKLVEFIFDEYGGNLSEYILGIVIGLIIFFVVVGILFGILNWAGDSFNNLFNWTGPG